MEKKRLIFDLDNTLLTGNYQTEKEYFYDIYGEQASKLLDSIGDYLEEYERKFPCYEEEVLSQFLSYKSCLIVTPEIVHGWIHAVSRENDVIEDGVVETLEHFKSKGKSLAVLTNWFSATQIPRLKNSGLYDYFDDIYSGESFLKPNLEAYTSALGRFLPEESVFIGDDLNKDYIGPRRYGYDSILYDKKNIEHNSIVKVKKIKELIRRY